MTILMPSIFFGHGNPMNALRQNAIESRNSIRCDYQQRIAQHLVGNAVNVAHLTSRDAFNSWKFCMGDDLIGMNR